MRFVQYWIEKGMENIDERQEETRKHMAKVQQLADEVKVRWNDADLPPGFWNSKTQASLGKDRMASIEASPISPTLQLLADMDEKKRRDQAKKTNTSGAASTDAKQEIKNLS